MSKHTKGPWYVIEKKHVLSINTAQTEEEEDRIEHEEQRDTAIAGIYGTKGATDQANAQLMAAAPTMLEELAAVEWSGNGEGDEVGCVCPRCGGVEWRKGHDKDCKLAAAIPKAKGG